MSDSQRDLEKKALRSARALVEMLERDDLLKRKRQTRALLIAAVPIVLALVAIAIAASSTQKPPDDAANRRRACELDAWNASAAEFERQARKDNPEAAYRDIQKLLERERGALMARAAAACGGKGG